MNGELKRKIDGLRDLLVGVVPVPTDQVKQITLGLIYKFMGDMDEQNRELGGGTFFAGDYQKYAWKHLMASDLSAYERTALYSEGLERMSQNANIPQLFRDIFKGAFLLFKNPDIVNPFLKGLNEFTYSHSEDLGDAYEYLLSIMGAQGKAGQFRTPRHIIDFIVECVQPQKNERILDPACGTAGFLVSAYKHILRENTVKDSGREGSALTAEERKQLTHNFTGYDISPDMVRISLVNLYLHQFSGPRIYEYDTLTSLERWDEVFDCILTNPPFMSPKGGIQPHNRFGVKSSRSEVLFVDYILEHLSPQGRAGVIVPEGIIFQSGNAYKQLRRKLVEEGYLYAVVSLPAGVFQPYSGVKTSILLIDRRLAQQAKDILFLKVENDGFDLGATRKLIEKDDLPIALKAIRSFRKSIKSASGSDSLGISECSYQILKTDILNNDDLILTAERYLKKDISIQKMFPFASLGEIAEVIAGQSPEGIHYNNSGEGLPFYQGKTEFTEKYLGDPKTWTTKTTKIAEKGDILISVRAPVGPVNISTQKICIGRGLTAIKPSPLKANNLFLFHMLKYMEKDIKGNHGSTFDSINKKDIELIKIPLPPLEVQRQIVAEIEAWQKVIDGARQVVANWKPEIKAKEGWKTYKVYDVCERVSRSINPANREGIVNFIGLENIESNTGILTGEIHKDIQDIKSTKSQFQKDEILYGKLRPNLNKVWLAQFDGICSTDILVFSANNEIVIPRFLELIFRGEEFNSKVMNGISGSQLPRVSYDHFSKIDVSLPSLKIQRKIVSEIEEQQKGVEACRRLIESHEAKIRAKIGEVWGA